MDRERMPVLIGVGQWSERREDPAEAASPIDILAAVAQRAADDAGAGKALLESLDTLALCSVMAWPMRDTPSLLANTLGIAPRRRIETPVGGNGPLALVTRVPREIAAATCHPAPVAGCDVYYPMLRARTRTARLAWPTGADGPGDGRTEIWGEDRPALLDSEKRHGLFAPALVYPLFENAWRARRGWSLAEHRRRLGALLAPMTAVAAENPYAWFPVARPAEEIVTPTAENRMVAFPYTKYMNAVLAVDQGAAVIVCSRARARALGVPEERCVYWWGGGDAAEQPWHIAERPDLSRAPGIARSGGAALAEANVAIADIEHLDLYSCFPCAVQLARDAIGIADDDPRPVTLTGGLPYAGGPGNAYTLHALACAVERLRAEPDTRALCTGVGWFLSKHSSTILASAPRPARAPAIGSVAAGSAAPADANGVAIAEHADGPATVETYTVLFDRSGAPTRGIVLARLPDGRRTVANTPAEPAVLAAFAAGEQVGRAGSLRQSDGRNLFDPS
jgi:acetyl-CoA C-acetyltransferase